MTAEQQLEQFQSDITELQQDFERKCSTLRYLAQKASDELREQKRKEAEAKLVVYTEAEAATVLKLGETTLRHMRTATPGFPCWRAGSAVRYTEGHLFEITELLRNREAARTVKKKRTQLRVARGR